jgi:hypothetical protein
MQRNVHGKWGRPRFAFNDTAVLYMTEYNDASADDFRAKNQRGRANTGPGVHAPVDS